MSRRLTYKSPFFTEQEDPDQPSTEDGPDSPSSYDDSKLTSSPSPKKIKKAVHKRVISVPISDVEGSKSKGDAYPPSDSWAWRKYGQKPIKGSPYPRGYYRCSGSKGCPARKQVERSRADPTMLVITYAHDHNHSRPTAKSHHHSSSSTVTIATSRSSSPPIPSAANSSSNDPTATSHPPVKFSAEDLTSTVFAAQPDLELIGDFGWLANVAYGGVLDSPICERSSSFDDADVVAAHLSVREDDVDDSLFGDLEELPECSVVFRRRVLLV